MNNIEIKERIGYLMEFIQWLVELYTSQEPLLQAMELIASICVGIGAFIGIIKREGEFAKYFYGAIVFVVGLIICFLIYAVGKVGGIIFPKPNPNPNPTMTTTTISDTIMTEPTNSYSLPSSIPYIGQEIPFGYYEQDYDSAEKEDIIWKVLDVQGDSVLLLSKHLLVYRPFNDVKENTDWNSSSLNRWLNNSFMNTAFDSHQKAMIQYYNNADAKVFLLSKAEASSYLSGNSDRIARLTVYAMRNLVDEYGEKAGYDNSPQAASEKRANAWWLRDNGKYANRAARVDNKGVFDTKGWDVDNYGVAVRPAIWVKWED